MCWRCHPFECCSGIFPCLLLCLHSLPTTLYTHSLAGIPLDVCFLRCLRLFWISIFTLLHSDKNMSYWTEGLPFPLLVQCAKINYIINDYISRENHFGTTLFLELNPIFFWREYNLNYRFYFQNPVLPMHKIKHTKSFFSGALK